MQMMPPMGPGGMAPPPPADPMAGGGMPPMGGGFPSTQPPLIAQLLGPLLQAQTQDDQALKQQQIAGVIQVLQAMSQSDQASQEAASAPAPVPPDAANAPPLTGGGV